MISDFNILDTPAQPLVPEDVQTMGGLLAEKGITLECLDITQGGAPYTGISGKDGWYAGCPRPLK